MKESNTKNNVFIATSLDGFIADNQGGIDWLDTFPELNTVDSGYEEFMSKIDAIVMGRNTFETVCNFDVPWPYKVPVFVLSHQLQSIPAKCTSPVEIIKGDIIEINSRIAEKGYKNLYIDGGKVIQAYLAEEMIDEITITIIPILLGSGIPLFSGIKKRQLFTCDKTTLFVNKVSQHHFTKL